MQILGTDNTGVIGKAIFYKGIDVNNIYISNNCFNNNFYAGYYGTTTGEENDTNKYRHKLLNKSVNFGMSSCMSV